MPLKLHKRPGSKVWHVAGTVRGIRVRETAGTEDRTLAEAYRAKREAELFESAVFGKRLPVPFDRAAAAYLRYEQRSGGTTARVERLIRHFRSTPIHTIRQADVDAAIDAIVGPTAAPATKVRGVHAPLMAILNHAAKREWCEFPRFHRPGIPRSETNWLTPAQALRLMECAAPHLRPLLHFLCCTGARLSEAIDLQWADVDLAGSKARFRDTKNGADRLASLPSAAVVTLANLPGRAGPVFLRDDGLPYEDRHRETGGQIRRAWGTACRRAGLVRWAEGRHVVQGAEGAYTSVKLAPIVTPHDLRHSWATWFYAVTKDPLLLKHEGGWQSLPMVERYAHLAPADIAATVRLVWGDRHPRIAGTFQTQPDGHSIIPRAISTV